MQPRITATIKGRENETRTTKKVRQSMYSRNHSKKRSNNQRRKRQTMASLSVPVRTNAKNGGTKTKIKRRANKKDHPKALRMPTKTRTRMRTKANEEGAERKTITMMTITPWELTTMTTRIIGKTTTTTAKKERRAISRLKTTAKNSRKRRKCDLQTMWMRINSLQKLCYHRCCLHRHQNQLRNREYSACREAVNECRYVLYVLARSWKIYGCLTVIPQWTISH
mmetsp:Transcript_16902/g.26912  ORF Transcript_16902/g.26912 Transcript_16902/m.26912 type:complete len:224 (-) Transcript_16902:1859-2530(-)